MKAKLKGKLTYANVVSTLCLFVLLGGSAYAALKIPRNSVGTRQLQAKSVTNGKLANGAVNGAKIAEGSITGQNINLSALGTVPNAANAVSAQNANTVDEHSASCPQGATLIRGLCFDAQPNPAVSTVKEAADDCAAKGGYLPSPLELYSVRGVLNLGTGVGSDHQYTDEFYGNTNGTNYRTVVVDGTGAISESEINAPSKYTCVYPLVR
ncbi:MAG: hypothetical protein WB507_01030 [Solirubrobacterales bacterium]